MCHILPRIFYFPEQNTNRRAMYRLYILPKYDRDVVPENI